MTRLLCVPKLLLFMSIGTALFVLVIAWLAVLIPLLYAAATTVFYRAFEFPRRKLSQSLSIPAFRRPSWARRLNTGGSAAWPPVRPGRTKSMVVLSFLSVTPALMLLRMLFVKTAGGAHRRRGFRQCTGKKWRQQQQQ